MTLPDNAARLLRELGDATEVAVMSFRNVLAAGGPPDVFLQYEPTFVTERPDKPLIEVLGTRRMAFWRRLLLASLTPPSGWFIDFDNHPVKQQLQAELLDMCKGYAAVDPHSQYYMSNMIPGAINSYIYVALQIYHALALCLGEDGRGRALDITADLLDARINLQRAAHFSGSYLYNFEFQHPEDLPIRFDENLELRLSTFEDVARLAFHDSVEGKYLPPAYLLVFRHTPEVPVQNALDITSYLDEAPIRDALTALRLCGNSYVGVGRVLSWISGIPTSMGFGSLTVDSTVASIISGSEPNIPRYELRSSGVADVVNTYQHLRHSPVRTRLAVALSRFGDSYRRPDLRERIIDLVIALENIFGQETVGQSTEVGYRLRMRAARYLGANSDDRRYLRKFFTQLYDLRSKIVHGDLETTDEEIQKRFKRPLSEVVDETQVLVRRTLQRLLLNPQHVGQEYFNDLLLGVRE